MIKKISAIVLALVLCLSIVVVPTSAAGFEDGYTLADGMDIAFKLEWDKEYYSAGDTAYLSVYMKVTDDMQLGTGSIAIGFNSAVFSTTDNPDADMKANAVNSDLWLSFWKASSATSSAWSKSTIVTKIEAANTDAETAAYDQYYKILFARNTSDGTHENACDTKYGLPGSDINADSEPIIVLALKVRDDVADNTKVSASVTTGTINGSPAQTAFKYIKNPGATTTANVATTAFDNSDATTTDSIIGEAPVDLILGSANREQIKFDKATDGTYAGTFAYRTFVELVNLEEVFGDAASADDTDAGKADNTYIVEAGYVVTAGTLDESGAKAYVEGTGSLPSSHVADDAAYISTSYISGKYVMALTVTNIPKDSKTASLGGLAYVKYMQNGTEKVAYFTITSKTFSDLYDTYYDKAFPNG